MSTDPDLGALGVDRDDAAAAVRAVTSGLAGNLVIVQSPDAAMALDVATALATFLLPADAELDLRLAIPAADRWTMDEVNERVLGPARLRAFHRSHVVVADADQMSQAAHDHVLKTVEEPTSGALFWFCVTDADALPVTVRGRAGAVLTVRPAPAAERVDLLIAAGADPDTAAEVAALAGDDVRLALSVARGSGSVEDLRAYQSCPLRSSTATAHADDLLSGLMRLAAALSAETGQAPAPPRRRTTAAKPPAKASVRPRWDALTVPQRAEARRLLRALLARWCRQERAAVTQATTREQLANVEAALLALADAREQLATNAPAATVLPALVAKASA